MALGDVEYGCWLGDSDLLRINAIKGVIPGTLPLVQCRVQSSNGLEFSPSSYPLAESLINNIRWPKAPDCWQAATINYQSRSIDALLPINRGTLIMV